MGDAMNNYRQSPTRANADHDCGVSKHVSSNSKSWHQVLSQTIADDDMSTRFGWLGATVIGDIRVVGHNSNWGHPKVSTVTVRMDTITVGIVEKMTDACAELAYGLRRQLGGFVYCFWKIIKLFFFKIYLCRFNVVVSISIVVVSRIDSCCV